MFVKMSLRDQLVFFADFVGMTLVALFFWLRASQVTVNTLRRTFEKQCELQVAKCLTVHVLSSSYNVYRLESRKKRKATQQWNFRLAYDFKPNQLRVYHERLYADKVPIKFWFVRCFSSQHYTESNSNNTSASLSQIRTKISKSRSIICKVNLKFLRSSRLLSDDTIFAVILSFLNETASIVLTETVSIMEG